ERLLKCRLAILDYPGTTLAQTLAANIPTICFWNNDQWLSAERAQPLFDALKKAGVVFDSPESAAEHLDKVHPEIEAWWQTDQVQAARAQWCEQYAQADPRWFWKWVKALWAL